MSRKVVKEQTEETWSKLHQRLTSSDADLSKIVSADLLNFINLKATSIGTNSAYYLMSMITTLNFLASSKKTKMQLRGEHKLGLNIFSIFVGPPQTAKSPAFKDAVTDPLNSHPELNVISKTTSSGLTKTISKFEKCYIASAEIYEYQMYMLKNDDENAIGDSQLLCKLFSGEQCELNYATENRRTISQYCSFCILGKKQLSF